MTITYISPSRVMREQLKSNPVCRNLDFTHVYRGTMREIDAEQALELNRLLGYTPTS